MTLRSWAAAVVAIGAVALPSAAIAAPVTVNVRVEGASQTLFEGPVTTYGHEITSASGGTHPCDGTNNGANPTPGGTTTTALVDALYTVSTPWDGTFDPQFDDYDISSIGPDAQTATEFWGLLDNWRFTPVPGCQFEPSANDQVLWAYNAFTATAFLRLTASATTVAPGQPTTVQVTDGSSGTVISGAVVAPVSTDPVTDYETVESSDPSAVTTDASGNATLSWSTPGWKRVKAIKANAIRSNRLDICVTPCGPPPADTLVRVPGPKTTDSVPSSWQSSNVTVTLTATDPFSSVAQTYYTVGVDPPDPTTASAVYDPANKPVLTDGEEIKYFSVNTGGVTDPVKTSKVAMVDTTPPTITITTPTNRTFYAINQRASASYSCADAGSGVATCSGPVPPGGSLDTTALGSHVFTVNAADNLGNTASQSASYTVAAAPVVTLMSPSDGATYLLGQKVRAAYSCQDGTDGPGIASCSGSIADGAAVGTSSPGQHSFTVTARSIDGQPTTATITYTVLRSSNHLLAPPRVTPYRDGRFLAIVKVPGPGSVNILLAARNANLAHAAGILQPGPGSFVFARAHATATRASTLRILVTPTAQGRQLIAHHRYRVTLQVSVGYTPTGGRQRTIGYYGVRLP